MRLLLLIGATGSALAIAASPLGGSGYAPAAPGVETAVVASPDPDRGHIVKAYVVLRTHSDACESLKHELQAHCKCVTAPYKYPRSIEFLQELPKTISGKIRRLELRQRVD